MPHEVGFFGWWLNRTLFTALYLAKYSLRVKTNNFEPAENRSRSWPKTDRILKSEFNICKKNTNIITVLFWGLLYLKSQKLPATTGTVFRYFSSLYVHCTGRYYVVYNNIFCQRIPLVTYSDLIFLHLFLLIFGHGRQPTSARSTLFWCHLVQVCTFMKKYANKCIFPFKDKLSGTGSLYRCLPTVNHLFGPHWT